MKFPDNLLYTKDHEWVLIEGDIATIGITSFATGELGDIVYVDIETQGEPLETGDIFGTIEAVKTVSDLFMPVSGTVTEVNETLAETPEIVNEDPYGKGWMVKVLLEGATNDGLMNASEYKKMIGK